MNWGYPWKSAHEGIHEHWHSASRVHLDHLTDDCSFTLLLYVSFSDPLNCFIWFPSPPSGWSSQFALGRPARSGFLLLHSAPYIKCTGEKGSHHPILQTQGGTTICLDAFSPFCSTWPHYYRPCSDWIYLSQTVLEVSLVKLASVWKWNLENL